MIGYSSTATASLQQALLRNSGQNAWNIHSRVLGNVIYLISNLNTGREKLEKVEDLLLSRLSGITH